MKSFFPVIILAFFFLTKNVHAQTLGQKDKYVYDNLDSVISFKTANKDIHLNRIKIFCQEGYTPTAYSKADSVFEFKYNVTYILFSCESLYEDDAMQEYNEEIGKYLDKLYGRSWRNNLRPDAIGLREKY